MTQTALHNPLALVRARITQRGDKCTDTPNDAGYYNTQCPVTKNHRNGDAHPSLYFKEMVHPEDEEDRGIHIKCFAGCTRGEILAAYGFHERDMHSKPRSSRLPISPVINPATPKKKPIDLLDFATDKLISYRFLMQQGVTDNVFTFHRKDGSPYTVAGVEIPYFHLGGSLHEKRRVRTALIAKEGSKWSEGDEQLIAYGLHKLKAAIAAGYLVIVEGESDTLTLWYHDLPALGVPGASNINVLNGAILSVIPKIYVIQEKTDQAGLNFPYAVQLRLRATGYTGEILRIPLKTLTGAKDPNELHKRLWDKDNPHQPFVDAFQQALEQARKMDIDTGEDACDPAPASIGSTPDKELEESIQEEKRGSTNDDAPPPPTLEQRVNAAIEQENIKALYDIAEEITLLPTKEQALLSTSIKNKMARCKDFSWAAFKKLMDEAVKARKAATVSDCATYEKTDTGMIYNTDSGEPVWISNFTAEIVGDVITDDGAERTRSYEIEAELFRRHFRFEVVAKDFAKSSWIDEHLGARARVTTGQSMQSHLINAIKYCSEPQEQFCYAHTGWRKINGTMVYLHSGGALSQVSQVEKERNRHLTHTYLFSDIAWQATLETHDTEMSQVSQVSQENIQASVKLTGVLAKYRFPSERGDLSAAIRASMRFADLASDTVTMPLYGLKWCASLGIVNLAAHLAGQSGMGKTELCALIQQHEGEAMNVNALPGSWESTENSLEMLLFQAKDVVVVVDDFKPKGGKVDQERLHAKADRVFRQIGNGSARGRLSSNLDQRVERRPRGLLISTGEDVPKGQSLKARGILLTMTEKITQAGTKASQRLYDAQQDAKKGLYAQATAGFIEWLAPRIETIQAQLPDLIASERQRLCIDGHARSGTNTAEIILAMKYFLQFAYESGAITREEADAFLSRCMSALIKVAEGSAKENDHDRPSEQWRRLLIASLTSKGSHLADKDGKYPGTEYGWVRSVRTILRNDGIEQQEETFRGGGELVGWIDGDDIYLLPVAAYKAAKTMGSATGDDITTLEPTLRKFLLQDGMLASTDLDKARKTILVRRRLEV